MILREESITERKVVILYTRDCYGSDLQDKIGEDRYEIGRSRRDTIGPRGPRRSHGGGPR